MNKQALYHKLMSKKLTKGVCLKFNGEKYP